MKVLVSAWACNPREGSESGIGWNWVRAIKKNHDAHVLTARCQREWIEAEVRSRPEEFSNVQFHYVEPALWAYDRNSRFWKWQGTKPLLVPVFHRYYRMWLRAAYAGGRDLHRRHHFDLVHQLTFEGFRFPGHLWKLDIPFVWGPIGGIEDVPWRLLPLMGVGGAAYHATRNAINSAHRTLLLAPRKAFRRAGAVIAATSGTQSAIRRFYGVDSEVTCEISTPAVSTREFAARGPGEPLRIAWSGLHLHRKALHLLLQALPSVTGDWRLDIYGDGPCHRQWQQLASRLGLDDRCTWHGQVPRQAVLDGFRRAHLFVCTSLMDLTSTVIIEALGYGLPVVCPDLYGFSDAVTDECGIKLSTGSPGALVRNLAAAISSLEADEARRRRLAAGALRRGSEFTWEVKVAAVNRAYERATAVRPTPAIRRDESQVQALRSQT